MLGTWNFWWVLEGSWFVSLPWSVIDWSIHNPNESPKTEFYRKLQTMIFATSAAGFWDRFPFNKELSKRQKCESCYIEDVWNFRKTSPNHPFQCFTFIAKPHGILVASPQQPHEWLEKEVQAAVETTNGVSVARWTCHLVFSIQEIKMLLSFLNAINQPSFFFRGTLI